MTTTRVLVTANSKGGCTKSTVSLLLAGAYASLGRKVLVVDADPALTATQWVKSAPASDPFPAAILTVGDAAERLHQLIAPALSDFDLVVIDCPPSVEEGAMARTMDALLIADVCIVPVQPTPNDLWATQGIFAQLKAAAGINPTLRAYMVATRVGRSRIASEVLAAMRESEVELLESKLGNRASFQEAAVRGSCPDRMGYAHKRAEGEVSALVQEISDRMEW